MADIDLGLGLDSGLDSELDAEIDAEIGLGLDSELDAEIDPGLVGLILGLKCTLGFSGAIIQLSKYTNGISSAKNKHAEATSAPVFSYPLPSSI
jgi:hypothetical protein